IFRAIQSHRNAVIGSTGRRYQSATEREPSQRRRRAQRAKSAGAPATRQSRPSSVAHYLLLQTAHISRLPLGLPHAHKLYNYFIMKNTYSVAKAQANFTRILKE